MGKSSRFMRGNMYENDVLDFDTLDDLEKATPIKSNKAIKKAIKSHRLQSSLLKVIRVW